ncbi:hypothetical protein E8F11_15455 [Pseudomonas sp. BN417]|uniref:PglL family O-oligosaccharyltransferase n=1 Tax=Pseudomonas sp. BN417 TaxID=2567890 RepID=UPI002457FEA1|nr:O-antigen ligase family protein [Pseudomonas sp. BN417]MDH4556549.1 hypothetical protein [Pseudomonas sp. BN417]
MSYFQGGLRSKRKDGFILNQVSEVGGGAEKYEYRKDSKQSGVGWLVCVLLASLPWLVSTHSDPWTTFYNEFLMVVVVLPWVGWCFWTSAQPWLITRQVLFVSCVSFIPIYQSVFGILLFSSEAVLSIAYILAFAIAISLGQRSQSIQPFKVVDYLFFSLIIASMLSTGLALYQWFALEGLGVLVPSGAVGGGRAVAHIGQPNNLSTLLAWGCAGFWWASSRRYIGVGAASLGIAFLLLGIVLTGSRTGCLQIAFLAGAALIWAQSRHLWRKVILLILLGGWFVLLLGFKPIVSEILFGASGRAVFSAGVRPIFWAMAIEGILDKPLLGYGWNQVILVHVSLADKYSGIKEIMGHAHNLFLDLLLWNGVLLGVVLVVAILWWLVRQVFSAATELHRVVLVVIGIFFIHAMLELPHLYLFFILPMGLFVGVASVLGNDKVVAVLPRYLLVVAGLLLSVLLAIVFREYRGVEQELNARRLLAAHISGAGAHVFPEAVMLNSLQVSLNSLDAVPKRNMPRQELERMHRAVLRYPTIGGLFRYAQASALNDRGSESTWAMRLICDLNPTGICDAAIKDWNILALQRYPEMSSVVLPKM